MLTLSCVYFKNSTLIIEKVAKILVNRIYITFRLSLLIAYDLQETEYLHVVYTSLEWFFPNSLPNDVENLKPVQ